MDRLLYKEADGDITCRSRDFDKVFPTLYAYEETGMTPEQVAAMKGLHTARQDLIAENEKLKEELEKIKEEQEKQPVTFADQVRRMDDEALAWQFASLFVGGMGGVMEGMGMKFNVEELLTMAYPRMMADLKEPAKEE